MVRAHFLSLDPAQTTVSTDRLTHRACDAFSFREGSQKILAEYLSDIAFAVPALQQFVSDVWKHRNILRAFGHVVRPVEIRADAYMIDTGNFNDVIDVIDQF